MWHFLSSIEYLEQFPAMSLDRFDKLILDELQKDGRISNVHLANIVNSGPTLSVFANTGKQNFARDLAHRLAFRGADPCGSVVGK